MKDKVLEKLIKAEEKRQLLTLDLIPSENYVPEDIRGVLGSVLVNKYSEGYPGKRYYPGNKIYDQIEELAKKRVLKMFDVDDFHVNVQPYSGSPANLAVYFSMLDCGEKLMGMQLASGGHLTHGHRVNFSGRYYKSVQYSVDLTTGLLDYEDIERMAELHQPKVIISGASAYPREIDFKRIGMIARKAGAFHVADISHIAGLVIAGLHQSPFPYADVVVSTTHKTLRGPRAAVILCKKDLADRIDRSVFPGLQGGPHNNQIAAIALMAWHNSQKNFISYQNQIVKNAKVLAGELNKIGFELFTGGTDNHLVIINLKKLAVGGRDAERLLEEAGILANRNSLPGDTAPINPSGLRLGTPAATTRGMKEAEMKKIAGYFNDLLIKKVKASTIRKKVESLCRKFK